jgi:hypothetical protein
VRFEGVGGDGDEDVDAFFGYSLEPEDMIFGGEDFF